MSRRKNVLMVTTGILIGILMAGTAAHAAVVQSLTGYFHEPIYIAVGYW